MSSSRASRQFCVLMWKHALNIYSLRIKLNEPTDLNSLSLSLFTFYFHVVNFYSGVCSLHRDRHLLFLAGTYLLTLTLQESSTVIENSDVLFLVLQSLHLYLALSWWLHRYYLQIWDSNGNDWGYFTILTFNKSSHLGIIIIKWSIPIIHILQNLVALSLPNAFNIIFKIYTNLMFCVLSCFL